MTFSKALLLLLAHCLEAHGSATVQEDDACVVGQALHETAGQALLQTKKQNGVIAEEDSSTPVLSMVDAETRTFMTAMTDRDRVMATTSMHDGKPVFLGSMSKLDDKGFQVVANTCCHLEMELYIRRVVTGMGLTVCDDGALMSMLPLFTTCETGKTNYSTLVAHINAAKPPNPCAFVAPAGACPKARPAQCVHDPEPASHRRRQCNAHIQKGASGECQLPAGAAWCEVRLKNLPPYYMAVYDWDTTEDWVSLNICQAGFWEENNILQFGTPGSMLDIGGNVGYHTFAFARAGWNVTTFEPMAPNLALQKATMCRNPDLAARVHLNEHGLGTVNQQCTMVAPTNNVGDGHTLCEVGGKKPTMATKPGGPEYKEIGVFNVRRLDEVLAEQQVGHVDLVKIDVEGFEKQVFTGAPDFLAKYGPRLIMSEVWIDMKGKDAAEEKGAGIEYLDLFEKAGYKFYEDNQCMVPVDGKATLRTRGVLDVVMCK